MSRSLLSLSFVVSLAATTASAEVPKVVVDIAPVHSLVARVMEGVGTPSLIVAPGASPHEYSLRPSEAKALQDADLVFWVSPELTPWLADTIGTLAGEAGEVVFMDVDGTQKLPFREGTLFEAHAHGHAEGDDAHHDDADHANHDDHDDHDEHEDEHGHEEHAGHDGHDHGEEDPHAWLSPANGAVWLNEIAAALSAADPENANAYFGNAAKGREELAALETEIDGVLDPVRGGGFIVFHDAYQYFEDAFDLSAAGAISLSDATDPSPSRIAEIQARVAEQGVSCVLSEPQFNAGIVASVMRGTEVNTGVLDPLGSDLEPGPALYPAMLRNLATALADCL
ncbi:zinc ABC transporter substrate-binding protein [Sulfitobacter sp. D35]|uniref:zinc ABC transporter substrate-binding protein n=1 Tax=Sulfitobacter sp. D35 TaxID=3083252 RepID=UPI00296F7615|nr:zinc ABC transporter substrate-binding protein [Sulfitobacter sp. D35]MDW4498853.1 zinc ABC transporter substrate-binding protein [Sulfitobacter sp. D35]